MKILVTGGSGFIGTNVIEHFSKKAEVVNIDNAYPRNKEHLKYWLNVDIIDGAKLLAEVKGFDPDYIIHLAARTDLDGKSLQDYDANITGVKNILKAAEECSNLKKILITSSMLVYKKEDCMPHNQFEYHPVNLYGESKVETEKITWANQPSCDWAILRPTSMWGPWFGVPYRNFFDMVKKGMYFHIGKKGANKTYGYIGNAIYQIETLLFTETRLRECKVFYLGDTPANNLVEWANEIGVEMGKHIITIPYWVMKCAAIFGDLVYKLGIHFPMTSFRLGNMTHDNIINLDRTLGIAPNPPYTRNDGTKITVEWMKEH